MRGVMRMCDMCDAPVCHAVTVAQSGTEAMRVLASAGPGTFQLVLTDLVRSKRRGVGNDMCEVGRAASTEPETFQLVLTDLVR
eukprot:359607-Chlamydomonas_euryale.AAC.3